MKRVAIFAHYDKDNIIDDYVIYYLKELKKVADIVFVSCNPIADKSVLEGLVSHIVEEKHDEYDFGSYKRGFFYLKNNNLLENYDELIFVNDSCYGPFYPLSEVFEEMENNRHCDFWGITKNKFGTKKVDNKFKLARRPHIQSYFLVFNKNVFMTEVFENFCNSIKHYDEKFDVIINYEIGLSELLVKNGFEYDSYNKNYLRFNNVIFCFWRPLIEKYRMPFVKCSILRLKNQNFTTTNNWQKTINKHSDYPVEIIEKNLARTTTNDVIWFNKMGVFADIYYFMLAYCPGIFKRAWSIVLKRFFNANV